MLASIAQSNTTAVASGVKTNWKETSNSPLNICELWFFSLNSLSSAGQIWVKITEAAKPFLPWKIPSCWRMCMLYQGVLLTSQPVEDKRCFWGLGVSTVPMMRDLSWTSFCYRNCVPISRSDGTEHGNRIRACIPQCITAKQHQIPKLPYPVSLPQISP